MAHTDPLIREFHIKPNEQFPNSVLPALLYKRVLKLPLFFTASGIEKLFQSNGWSNNWRGGIYTRHHYHSNTHEAIACIKGGTILLLGGENGKLVHFERGDVVIIPAGVAHKNLGKEKDVCCIGGYPNGLSFDLNFGLPTERPQADHNIAQVTLPEADPVYGDGENGLLNVWK